MVAAGLLVVCLVVLGVAEAVNRSWAWPDSLQLLSSYLAVAVASVVAQTRPSLPARVFLVGCALWLAADLIGLALGVAHLEGSWSLAFELTYLAGQVAWAAAALLFLRGSARATSWRRLVDGILFGLLVVLAMYTLASGATLDVDRTGYGLGLLWADGVFVTAVALAAAGSGGWQRRAYLLIVASAILLLASDVSFLYGELLQADVVTWLSDLGWSVSSLLRVAGMLVLIRRPGGPEPLDLRFRQSRLLVPSVLLVAGIVAAIRPPADWPLGSIVTAALVLVLLVVREALVAKEARRIALAMTAASVDLERRAEHDDLTGLLRRDRILDHLDAALATASADGGSAAAVYVDVDNFKTINDTFGHAVGDRVLTEVARRLVAAAAGDLVGRVGGDEFVIVVRSIDSNAQLAALEARLEREMRAPLRVTATATVRVGVSIGVATTDGEPMRADELLARADRSAFRAKQALGYSGEATRATPRPVQLDPAQLVAPLRALEEGRLDVWYQPFVRLRTGRIVGAEALVRLVDEDGAVRDAGSFLPFLLAAGRGPEVTALVVGRAIRAFASGPAADRGWLLSVNLSERDLATRASVALVASTLASSDMEPSRLLVEIDEHAAPNGATSNALEELRALGVGIALDDFGARSSTFGQIDHLAPAILKLDKSLISASDHPPEAGLKSPHLVDAFIRLAHHLGMRVIAEGIEHPAQRAALDELGCDYGQGYLWSRARPLDELLAAGAVLAGEPVASS